MSADDLTALNEQIAGMARAGLPLDQGLDSLAKDLSRGQLRRVTQTLAEDLRAGHPLPEALARQQGRIPPYYANLVTAGVKTGRLPEVLSTLTGYARAIANLRTTIIDAMLYPLVVFVLGCGLLALLFFVIQPQFARIITDFNIQVPMITRWFIALGQFPMQYVALPVAVFIVVVILAWLLFRLTPAGRKTWAKAVYCLPVVGTLVRAARLTAFTDLLAMLVEYNVPLPEAFELAGGASTDPVMAAKAVEVHDQLMAGMPLAAAFRGRGLVPEWVVWMAENGENRGELAAALRQVATIYRRQVETRASLLKTLLPPILILMIGGVMLIVFGFTFLMPMVRLLEGLAK